MTVPPAPRRHRGRSGQPYGCKLARPSRVDIEGGGHPRPGGEGGMQAPGGRRDHILGGSTAAAEIAPRASYMLPAPIAKARRKIGTLYRIDIKQENGAQGRNRTTDTRIFSQPASYSGSSYGRPFGRCFNVLACCSGSRSYQNFLATSMHAFTGITHAEARSLSRPPLPGGRLGRPPGVGLSSRGPSG